MLLKMILSTHRLDHLSILSEETVEIKSLYQDGSELIVVSANDITSRKSIYEKLYLERFEHLDLNFVKAVIKEYSKIEPDDIVPFNDKYAVLKDDQVLALPTGIVNLIKQFDFSLYEGYSFISNNMIHILAWEIYRTNHANTLQPKIALGKLFLARTQSVEITRLTRSLTERGWEYVNFIRDYDGLYQEFARAWELETRIVTFGDRKYFFVKCQERIFHGTLEQWISESLVLLINNSLPRVYIFEYPRRGYDSINHLIKLKYIGLRAFSKLVDTNSLLANFYADIQVHRDSSVELRLSTWQEVQMFKCHLKALATQKFYEYQVNTFYEGVIYRHIYPEATLVPHLGNNFLVGPNDFVNLCQPFDVLEKEVRQKLLNFYSFCQPKLPELTLIELLQIVPKFISFEPLVAFCDIKHNQDLPVLSEFLYQTLEFAWRGYYAYAIFPGLLSYIPYTEPYDLTTHAHIIKIDNIKLLEVNIQGINAAIGEVNEKDIEEWNQEKTLVIWAKYYLRKYDQFSKVLLTYS